MKLPQALVPVLLALLAAPVVAGVKEDLDSAARVAAGDHAAWARARDKLVAAGEPALNELEAAGAAGQWTAANWPRALAAESARLRIQKPEHAAKVDNPRGIDPAFYGITRPGKPFCQRDFAQLARDGCVPLLLERWRYSLDAKPFSEGDAGKLERDALARALLAAPGQVGDTRARFVMLEALRNATLPDEWRQDAAVSYGQTGGETALADLGAMIDDGKQPLPVREAAAWALGRVPEKAALDAIRTRLGDSRITGGESGPAMVRALANGAGILGSAWGWKARGETAQEKANEIRKACATVLVETLKQHPAEVGAISDALVLVAWRESAAWLQEIAASKESSEALKAGAQKCADALKPALAREK